MRFLFVIDELKKLKPQTDSTIDIMQECVNDGLEAYFCHLKDLLFAKGAVQVSATHATIANKKIKQKGTIQKSLDFFDLIFMRKEPPYDLNYHYATMLLEKSNTPVFNSPQGLRNANEKLSILNFPNIIPKTLVSRDVKKIDEFLEENKNIIIKPIHLFGGKGLMVLNSKDSKAIGKIRNMTKAGADYVLVQEFLPEIKNGDKRILLLNGESLGGIRRIPKKGSFKANLAQGGTPLKLDLQAQDHSIIQAIKPYLQKQGLVFVGIDIIGDKLIEINVTCPTGLVQLRKLDKKNVTKAIVEFMKSKARKHPLRMKGT